MGKHDIPARESIMVIGGGLAGLAATLWLARAGMPVTLLERSARPGGRGGTLQREGFSLNYGPHALYRKGLALDHLRRLGIPVAGGPPGLRTARVEYHGQQLALPDGVFSLVLGRHWRVAEKRDLMRIFGALRRHVPPDAAGCSLGQWLHLQTDQPRVQALIAGLVRLASYTHPPEDLPAPMALAQLRLGLSGVIYVHGGWQTLVDALADRARRAGASIHTNAGVVALRRDDGLWHAETSDGSVYRSRHAVLATPPREAARLLNVPETSELAHFVRTMRPVRAACLDLGLRRSAAQVPTFVLGLDRPHYYSVHSANARLAPPGTAMLHLMRYLPHGATVDGREAIDELYAWLDAVAPGAREDIAVARPLPAMTVSWHVPTGNEGSLRARPAVAVDGQPDTWLCGEWVGEQGLLSDACFASAYEVATRIIEEHNAGSRARRAV